MDWIGITLAILLFVVGIPLAYFIGRRNRQVPDLRSAVDFDKVIAPGDWLLRGDLDISFNDRTLDRVSRTYIALWNHRGDTVRAADILPTDPLRVSVANDDEILQTRVVAFSREQVGAKVSGSGGTAALTFDFLDRGDGFVIEVMHRGATPASLEGTVPGAAIRPPKEIALGVGARRLIRMPWFKRVRKRFAMRRLTFAVFLAAIASSLWAATGVVGRIQRWLNPQLVDVTEHELDNLDGQIAFARAVTRNGGVELIDRIGDVVMLLAVLFPLSLVIWTTITFIPRNVVKHDVDEDSRP